MSYKKRNEPKKAGYNGDGQGPTDVERKVADASENRKTRLKEK